LNFFITLKKSAAYRKLCSFVVHISSHKISKICKQRFFQTRKKWVSNIGFGAIISSTVRNFRIPLSQLSRARRCPCNGYKKFGVSLDNFPLCGDNRFDRGLFDSFKKTFPLNLDGQKLCRFIEHIGPIRQLLCEQRFLLTRKNGF